MICPHTLPGERTISCQTLDDFSPSQMPAMLREAGVLVLENCRIDAEIHDCARLGGGRRRELILKDAAERGKARCSAAACPPPPHRRSNLNSKGKRGILVLDISDGLPPKYILHLSLSHHLDRS
nr:uncharacterized protein LOC105723046 [Aotus nancymaae]